MSDLKPCPFCGGDAEWVDIHDDEYGNTGGSVIECMSCGASTHVEFGFKENLTSAWNTRATPDPLSDPRVKSLVRAIKEVLVNAEVVMNVPSSIYAALRAIEEGGE